ncbi:NACHT domain-containing protein [Streptomyces sp. NBC_01410]|uniref:NACHT domain-containing protein n=1 Tax=Streptomyces sp. NBC_01410 TaxID=2903856 RepID=UPI0032460A20
MATFAVPGGEARREGGPNVVLAEVAAGVIVEAVAGTARWLRRESARPDDAEQALVRWFDTYQLTGPGLDMQLPQGLAAERVEEFLHCDDSQAVLHELLAVRLTDTPEAVVERLRDAYEAAARARLSPAGADGADVEGVGAELFDYFDLEIATLVGRLAGADTELHQRVRTEAFSARIAAVLGAIEQHVQALTVRDSACLAADQAFVADYRSQLVSAHGSLEPPDFARRRRVPINALHVSPRIQRDLERRATQDASQDVGQGLGIAEFENVIDRTVLLGDPGCGKSTTCQVLMHRRATDPGGPVPFLVVLRDFALMDNGERSVVDHIEHRLETYYQCPAPPGAVKRLLLDGAASVIFDGLDELVDSARRREVTEIVELFATRYPQAAVLVTSRVVGYNEARLDDRFFECYRLGPFDEARTEEYVRKWFAQEEEQTAEAARQAADIFLAESGGLVDLRSNPLMLALMCILYRGTGSIPRSRPEVYEQCSTMLFQKWDVRRRIHIELKMAYLVEPALRYLAYWLFTQDRDPHAVTERELVARVVDFLRARGYENLDEAESAARQFVGFCRGRAWVFSEAGTTAHGESLYTFTHRTFLEYFAAAQLASTSDTPEALARRLAPRVARQEWDIVGQLAVQIKERSTEDGGARVFATLLSERRRRSPVGRGNVLAFLARCLTCVDPPPRLVRQLTRATVEHLAGGDAGSDEFSGPVSWLLGSCRHCRDCVSDELSLVIADLVASGDEQRRLTGLRLAASVDVGAAQGSSLSGGQEFWWDFARRMVSEYAAQYQAAAHIDVGLMDVCLGHGMAGLREYLPRFDSGISSLFVSWPMGFFDSWQPYATRCVFVLLSGEEGSRPPFESVVRDCSAVGAWVREHPDPPWADDPLDVSRFLEYFTEKIASSPPSALAVLDADGYLGAAVLLLTSIEASQDPRPQHLPEVLGPLAGLAPYLEARHNEGATALPALPVPDGFGELLRSWARREVHFVRQ